jgi:hypothetical protein
LPLDLPGYYSASTRYFLWIRSATPNTMCMLGSVSSVGRVTQTCLGNGCGRTLAASFRHRPPLGRPAMGGLVALSLTAERVPKAPLSQTSDRLSACRRHHSTNKHPIYITHFPYLLPHSRCGRVLLVHGQVGTAGVCGPGRRHWLVRTSRTRTVSRVSADPGSATARLGLTLTLLIFIYSPKLLAAAALSQPHRSRSSASGPSPALPFLAQRKPRRGGGS